MNEKLKSRQMEILKYLTTSTIPLDISFFERKFNKSARTIRYDMCELKNLCEKKGVEIRYQVKKGYFIPPTQKMLCSEILVEQRRAENTGFLLDTDEERYKKLFLFFFSRRGKVSAEQVAEQFFISRSTLLRLLTKMEKSKDEDISLVVLKSGGYELSGSEVDIRKKATEILTEYFKGSYTAEDWFLLIPEFLRDYVSLHEIKAIMNGVKKVNERFNLWISNTSFLTILSYCIVRNIRFYKIKPFSGAKAEKHQFSKYTLDLLKEISIPNESIDVLEAEYMEEILIDNGIIIKTLEPTESLLKETIEKMIESFREEIVLELGETDFEKLYTDLIGHLKNTLCANHINGKQPEENSIVIQEVKENYSKFYDMAKRCSEYLKERMNVTFSETEICYIAVYLYKNCKEKCDLRKNVLIVCATGKGLSHLLSIRVERFFPMIKVVGQASPFQLSLQNYQNNVDFIISTIPLSNVKLPVIKISRILTEKDVERIREFLNYGNVIDEIPLKQIDKAFFGSKTDPYALAEMQIQCGKKELVYATEAVSKLILTLLEYTSKFPAKYQMGQDAMLGLIVHVSMAVPRWYENRKELESEEFIEEYSVIRKNHKEIFEIMESFFMLVENSMQVTISTEERMAFYLYIIKY